jgi:hypothetical protein
MTDLELMERFEDGTLPIEAFHHEEHVRVAFSYLSKYSVLDSLERFSGSLRRFAERHGKTGLYHETITWAYVLLIRERMARVGQPQTWAEFKVRNADLWDGKTGILKKYYRAETLTSELAKNTFLLPDKAAEWR